MKLLEFKNEGIYVILNIITEECYIGSSTNIGSRITKHKSLLKHNKHDNHILQNAYNQYGESKFKFGVLEYCKEDKLNREQVYVDRYKTTYNITKEVINNTPSIESRLKMSITRVRMFKEGLIKPNGAKCIIQTDLKGNFIAEFPSIMEAARKTKVNRSGIQRVLYGTYKQMKGFKFSYKLVL